MYVRFVAACNPDVQRPSSCSANYSKCTSVLWLLVIQTYKGFLHAASNFQNVPPFCDSAQSRCTSANQVRIYVLFPYRKMSRSAPRAPALAGGNYETRSDSYRAGRSAKQTPGAHGRATGKYTVNGCCELMVMWFLSAHEILMFVMCGSLVRALRASGYSFFKNLIRQDSLH